MRDDFEKALDKFFPSELTAGDFSFFIENTKYKLDEVAIKNNLTNPIRDFILRGGKRLRPIMFLTLLKTFGIDYNQYYDIAILIEVVHNGTLVLDDIEDNGLLRRGLPTCHQTFGLDTATNVGFAMHVLPLRVLLKNHNNLSYEQKQRLWAIYVDEMINVASGQAIDIYWHKNIPDRVTEMEYLEMARLKTGSLMRMSVRMASVIAGKTPQEEILLKEFAESVGIAFQIIDDILDLNNEGDEFGKAYGNDITEGKMSLPIVYALDLLENSSRIRLLSVLKEHTRDADKIKSVILDIKKSGAIEKAYAFAENLVQDAWDKVEKAFSHDFDLTKFQELTFFLVKRSF